MRAPKREKTGFDRYLAARMKDPSFAAGFARDRAEIDEIDALVRQLDEARIALGLSKGELARRAGKLPAFVRRLLLAKGSNPTLRSTIELARHLGLRLTLVPLQQGQRRTARTLSAKRTSAGYGATDRGTMKRKRSPSARTRS